LQKNKTLNPGLVAGLLISLVFVAGCAPAGAGGEGSTTSSIYMVVFLVLIFGMFYFLMIRPQRKRQKEHEQLIQELRKGDKVITAGGIYGQVESLSEDSLVIKVESGATMRVARGSIIGKRGK